MKVLATNASLPYDMLQKLIHLSDKELPDNQFRVICKCRGIADANRKCEANGLGEKVFLPGRSSIVVNGKELDLCKEEDIWIRIEFGEDKYDCIREVKHK